MLPLALSDPQRCPPPVSQAILDLHPIQQLAQRRDLTAGIGGEGILRDRHAEVVGIQADLSDETRFA